MALVTTTQALSGSEVEYTIPKCSSITFRPNGGDVTVASTTGSTDFTITDGQPWTLEDRSLEGQIFYFDGTATLEIAYLTGLMS